MGRRERVRRNGHPPTAPRLHVSADNAFVMKKQLVERFNMEPKAADKEIGLGDIDYVD